ncbi:MAG TPA: Flp pilus assembly protein CpaB, partial [Croceibacterium sp.]|nr:Flp pilus assembly protein CpaB [Croceibacterium sp.]
VETRQEQVAREQQLARIVVATQPLEFGQPLTAQNLRLQNFPQASVPQGAFTSLEEAMRGGRVALRPIVPGEPVLADKVSGTDGRAVLAANLADGMRAVAIPIGATTGVSGFARPGDTVDVLLTRKIPGDGAQDEDVMTDVILERVKLLAIDQVANENETKPKVGKTAVVEVNLYDAQKLVLADRLGTLSLALRNVENDEPAARTTVTARDLGAGGLMRPIRARPQQAANFTPPQVITMPAAGAPSAPPRRLGPTMSVYRGVELSEEPVGRLGGS